MEQSNSYKGNAYHIITDLHDHPSNKSNRIDYPSEVKYVKDRLDEQIDRYAKMGYANYLLYGGDIWDRSIRGADAAMAAQNDMYRRSRKVNGVFVCVGNHEFTYHKNNPFWHLVKSIESDRINRKNTKGGWKEKGNLKCLNVVDKLVDGDVEFIFNHYSAGILTPEVGKKSIGIFHQDIIFKGIVDYMKSKNIDVFQLEEDIMTTKFGYVYLDNNIEVLRGYDLCFFCHNHKTYGTFINDEIGAELDWLASLGRTNATEVHNSFLERRIPTVIVENGKFVRKDENYIALPRREECIDEVAITLQKEKYERSKEKKEVKEYVGTSDNPVNSLRTYFGNQLVDLVIDGIVDEKPDEILLEYRRKLLDL